MASPTERRRLVRDAAIGLLVAAAILGLVETALRAAGVPSLASERDPFQGFSARMRVFERDDDRGVFRTAPRAVRHSFNEQEFLAVKPSNGLRLFTIGGSSAYGFPWGAGSAFTHLLGRALEATLPGRRIEAVNAAAMSYGSTRLRLLAGELLDYDPDLLVVFEAHNEFVERRLRQAIESSPRLGPVQAVLARSRIYSVMSRAYERILRSSRGGSEEPGSRSTGELLGLDVMRETATDVDDRDREKARLGLEENYRAIARMCRERGVGLVLCTVPCNLRGWSPDQSIFAPDVGLEARREVLARIAEAKRALASGDAARAAGALERARSLAPGYAEVHFLLGRTYEALSRWDDARGSYSRARDEDAMPSRVPSSFNEAIRRIGREEPGVLLVDVARAFEEASPHGLTGFELIEDYVHPTPTGHLLIARELWKAILGSGLLGGRREADPAAFDRAVGPASRPEARSPALLFNLGVVMENKGLVDEAIASYRACLELDPSHPRAHYNVGRLLHRKGRYAEAEAEHRLAVRLDPDYAMGHVGLGEALRAQGRLEEARAVLERATRADPGSAYAWNGLGAALAASGDSDGAEAAFRKAIELAPERSDARANLGFALLSRGKLAEAEAVFREALGTHPEHAASRNGLAGVLLEKGDLDGSERLLRETLASSPGDPFATAALRELARRRASPR